MSGETEVLPAVVERTPPSVFGGLANAATGEVVALRDATLGIAQVPIDAREAAILRAPADPETEIEVRWDGNCYMPAAMLRKRLLDAFGPGQWAMRQEAPLIFDQERSEIIVECSLWIRGRYVSRAIAGWTWNEKNQRMSKTDAIESAHTECLRRLLKDLGVGLELWMPGVADAWRATHAEQYSDKFGKLVWRRKDPIRQKQHDDLAQKVADVFDGTVQPDAGNPPSADPSPAAPPQPASGAPLCPKCGAIAVNQVGKTGKTGKKLPAFKCSTGRFNRETKKTDGCDWTEWDEKFFEKQAKGAGPTAKTRPEREAHSSSAADVPASSPAMSDDQKAAMGHCAERLGWTKTYVLAVCRKLGLTELTSNDDADKLLHHMRDKLAQMDEAESAANGANDAAKELGL